MGWIRKITGYRQIKFSTGLTISLVYFLAAKVGLLLATINHHASPIWPATGVGISCLIIFGRQYWSFIWLGAFVANVFLGAPLIAVLMIATGNTLESVASKVFFRRFADSKTQTIGMDLIVALFSSVFFAVPLSATIGVLSLSFTHVIPWEAFKTTWFTWWTGDAIGAFMVVPFAVSVMNREFSTRRFSQWLKLGAYYAFAFSASYVCLTSSPENTAMVMFLFPVLLFGVVFFNSVESGIASFIPALMSIALTLDGRGPFYGSDFNSNLICLQLFIASIILTELVLRFIKTTTTIKSSALVICLSWLVTGLAFHFFNQKEFEIDKTRYQRLVSDTSQEISERMLRYETALRAGAGLFRTTDKVLRKDWKNFVSELQLDRNFPGFYGMGYVYPVKHRDLGAFVLETRKDLAPDFAYRKFEIPGVVAAPESASEHFLVMAVEPERARASRPPGLDLATDQVRYSAAVKARDEGKITISQPVVLQNKAYHGGFLIFNPLYREGMDVGTVEARRKAFFGWVFCPLLTDVFFQGLFTDKTELAIEAIFEQNGSERLLYSSVKNEAEVQRRDRMDTEFDLWGQKLKIRWFKTAHFESRKDTTAAWLNFISVMISLLLASLVTLFENTLMEAQRIADQKTRQLASRDRLWSSLTRVAPIGIFQLDHEGKLIFVNERWIEFTQISQYQIPHYRWLDALQPEDRPGVENQWNQLREGRINSLQAQCRIASNSKTFALCLEAVQDETDKFIHFIGTIQDISEIHQRQMQMMSASRMATIGEMAAGVAHEINNPLTIIAGRTQLAMKQLDLAEIPRTNVQDSMKIIRQTVDRIAKIVRGLRVFSRSGEYDVYAEASVPEMIRTTMEFCSERFRNGRVELRLKNIPDIKLACREVQTSQVLLNLLSNSFDAVANLPERWVEIDIVEDADFVSFRVTDSGRGISPQMAEKIMTPFFTTKPVGQGTGLGLSISKGIARDHKGELYVDHTSPNTRFVFKVSRHLLEDGSRAAAG